MKTCGKCGQEKTLSEFHRSSSKKDGVQAHCKVCSLKRATKWNADNRDRRLEYFRNTRQRNRATRYGLSEDDLTELLQQNNGSCGICGSNLEPLVVDHDHETRTVRGALCNRCNRGLGHFRDSATLLEAAINYLRQNG